MEYNLTPDEILNEIARIRKENNLPKDERVKELSKFEIDNLPSIPDNWKWVIINDISEFITNGVHTPTSTEDDNGFGLHCLRITDLKENGNIDYANLPYCLRIVEGDYDKKLKKDDIYFSFTGNNLGKRYIVKETREDTVFAHYFVRWHPILVDPYYIYYVTYSKIYDYFITANKHGSTQPNLKVMDLKRFPIPLCDLNIQRKISKILKNIDDKIEVNNQINDNLLELGMSMISNLEYTNFIPLKEKSEIISKGTTPTGKDMNEYSNRDIKFVKVRDFTEYGVDESSLEYIPNEIHNGKLKRSILLKDDLLVSIAGTLGKVAIVSDSLDNANTNQAVAFIRLKDINDRGYLYFYMKTTEFQEEISKRQVHAVQPNLSLTELGNIKVPKLNEKDYVFYNTLLEKILANNKQNETLTQLRDTLLPKLMNGEIDLDKIEI